MVENLNGDVIFDICKFMDLPSIVSLAVVYPQRSADIFRVLKNRVYSLRVEIVPQHISVEYYEMKNEAEKQHIPFAMLHTECLEITQGAEIPEEVEEILSELVINSMSLQYVCRLEAKKVLELVTFTPAARLSVFELSKSLASESLIPQKLFEDGDELVFVADMLPDEFSRVLRSAIRFVFVTCERLRPEFTAMVQQYIERFLRSDVSQLTFSLRTSSRILREIFENVAGKGEVLIRDGSRQVEFSFDRGTSELFCSILE
ncbi:hypothetical protein Y032_0017g3265 [Ancylostoma ceylanicum]|uniref:F-box domain-containing protein n=1 Tax=Ancylostoma ceylanicum TaxID=53326 RepID=A0A016V5K3_9BILA|nr:hypothetical protein Y032_0017g3265 [Ancylostoma ceylanicum]